MNMDTHLTFLIPELASNIISNLDIPSLVNCFVINRLFNKACKALVRLFDDFCSKRPFHTYRFALDYGFILDYEPLYSHIVDMGETHRRVLLGLESIVNIGSWPSTGGFAYIPDQKAIKKIYCIQYIRKLFTFS